MKLAARKQASNKPTYALAAGNTVAKGLFGGKTLHSVGSQYDLDDSHVTIVETANTNGRPNIKSLCVEIGGVKWLVPFSRNFPMASLNNADYLMNCEFRTGFVAVKEEDGVTPKTDENGAIVLNESKPYITFGKPSGITVVGEEQLFEEEKVANTAGKS